MAGNDQVDRQEVAINYLIPAELHSRAKSLAAWKGQTLRVWVTRAIDAAVEAQEAERAEQDRRRRRH
jgi:hypothetical protein